MFLGHVGDAIHVLTRMLNMGEVFAGLRTHALTNGNKIFAAVAVVLNASSIAPGIVSMCSQLLHESSFSSPSTAFVCDHTLCERTLSIWVYSNYHF